MIYAVVLWWGPDLPEAFGVRFEPRYIIVFEAAFTRDKLVFSLGRDPVFIQKLSRALCEPIVRLVSQGARLSFPEACLPSEEASEIQTPNSNHKGGHVIERVSTPIVNQSPVVFWRIISSTPLA